MLLRPQRATRIFSIFQVLFKEFCHEIAGEIVVEVLINNIGWNQEGCSRIVVSFGRSGSRTRSKF